MTRLLLAVDPSSSTVVVHTRAEGLLARLAHDLELRAQAVTGSASADGDAWTAELQLPVASLRATGVLHGEQVDTGALSQADRRDIERKMLADVFGGAGAVDVKAAGSSRASGEATIAVGAATARARVELAVTELSDGRLRASGRLDVSLKALGSRPIKGPLGAFSVKDLVRVAYDLTLIPPRPPQAP